MDLELELSVLQGVIDQQDNIVFVLKKDEIITVNQSFLDFFRVPSIDVFLNEYTSVLDTFIRHQKFFSQNDVTTDWISDILNKHAKDRVVSIVDLGLFEPRAFTVQINELSSGKENRVVTLSDITDIKLESEKYYYHATHDVLTEQFNRSYFIEKLSNEINSKKIYDTDFCLVLLDVDNFKTLNHFHGYEKGDIVLKSLGINIFKNIRQADILARWSGVEFIILLEKTNKKDALKLSELLRNLIENLEVDDVPKFTASFGVVEALKDENENDILKRVDEVLTKAKQIGKNIVVEG